MTPFPTVHSYPLPSAALRAPLTPQPPATPAPEEAPAPPTTSPETTNEDALALAISQAIARRARQRRYTP